MASFGRHSVDVFYHFLIGLFGCSSLLSFELRRPIVAFISLYQQICNKNFRKKFKKKRQEEILRCRADFLNNCYLLKSN